MARSFSGWCGRVTRVLRSDFGPLAKLAAIPAAVTFAQLLAGESPLVEFGFGLLMLLAISLAFGAGLFTVVRRANAEYAPWGSALRFGLRGLPRLIGWTLVFVCLMVPLVVLALLPGFGTNSPVLLNGGSVLAAVLAMSVGGAIYAATLGAVLVEGQGLGRGLGLLRGRWTATCLRMLLLGGLSWAYSEASAWLVTQVADAVGPGWIASLVQAVLTIPALVLQIVVMAVTYAELRGRADGTGTGGLAAGLAGRLSSRPVGAVPHGGSSATVIIAERRRRRGFGGVAPVLVLAVLLAAGGPGWSGVGSSVVPMSAVSPVPIGLDDGAGGGGDSGGDSGGDAGAAASVSGSSDSGSDNGGNSGGDKPPEVSSSKGTPDSGAGGDKGGDSGQGAAAEVRPPSSSAVDSGAEGNSSDTEVQRFADSGTAKGSQQGSRVDAPAEPGSESPSGQRDTTVAGGDPTKRTDEQSSRIAAPPPSVTDPENQSVTATPRRPGDPVQLTESATTPRTPTELPPGAASAVPGSLPAPGTERIMIDGQPVDMSTEMMKYSTKGSTAANVWAEGRQKTLVGTCVEGSHSCSAHAIDGTNRSFPFYREDVNQSAREAMDGLAVRSWQNRDNPNVVVAPTPDEFDQIRAESMERRAVNDRNNELVNEGLSFLPGVGQSIRILRGTNYIVRELVPSQPLGGSGAGKTSEAGKLPEAGAAGRDKLAQGETQAVNRCRNSFTATTLVLMADGTRKPIKDVARGNTVLAADPVTGERGSREVTDLIRHGGPHTMVAVQLAGAGQIDATDKHPFWVASQRKWVDAIDLKPGDVVLSDRGDQIKVTNLKTSQQDLTAYNLTVAGLHTYYVGDKPVLVHNTECPPAETVNNLPEATASKPLKPSEVDKAWSDFLGPGPYTNINPRTGQVDPNRIVSADGRRSIRMGDHEMNSKPTKFHYHAETWDWNSVTNTWTVGNTLQRVPLGLK